MRDKDVDSIGRSPVQPAQPTQGAQRSRHDPPPPASRVGHPGRHPVHELTSELLKRTEHLVGRPLRSALDIGHRVGRLTPVIADHADQVTTVDLAATDLAAADLVGVPVAHAVHGHPFDVAVSLCDLTWAHDDGELPALLRAVRHSARFLIVLDPAPAPIPAGPYARLRLLTGHLLSLVPGAAVVECRELTSAGRRSFAALIDLGLGSQPPR
ncbi:hypothetical protein SAMN05421505_103312 [Sinosporangium album]|uniref:Methyltransferase domain-containing protein n=1 Tax=Sinosporangium album TaxID=504805 RepID=A0A1G7TK98_9ACTN|nr:hypothetical protein [Sinosporangium album]SDG35705.1 hypothetical protein SAMN05421505_103312 [Sinosporangium album]